MAGNKPGGQRTRRVADAILGEVADLLRRRIKDPRIGFLTLTGVEVTPDLRHAKVFYSVVGDAAQRAATRKGLDSATPFVQGEVGRRLRLRNTPTLEFRFDASLERGQRIEQLLKEAGVSTEAAAASPGPADEPPGGEGEPRDAR
jgi:ribosome-binding factor A